MKISSNRIKAFTLAEVTIVLTIVGVIAMQTIPALLQTTQQAETKTAIKKYYSVLSQITQQLKMDNAGTINGLCADISAFTRNNCMMDHFSNYLNYTTSCYYNTDNCFHKKSDIQELRGLPPLLFTATSGLVLSSGTTVLFHMYSTCSPNCGEIYIDINGLKPPAIIGKDIFVFTLKNDRIVPYGAPTVTPKCDENDFSDNGFMCATYYIMDK